MKIALSGATGNLGSTLQEVIGQNHEVVTLGRNEASDLYLDLEGFRVPSLVGLDGVVHSAWPMFSRDSSTQRLAAESSIRILAEAIELGIAFIFISTTTADLQSPSNYAASKAYVERSVLAYERGAVLRVGNLIDSSSRLESVRLPLVGRYLRPNFVPDIQTSVTTSKVVAGVVLAALELGTTGLNASFNQESSVNQLLGGLSPGTRRIPVPSSALDALVKLFSPNRATASLMLDSWRALRFSSR